MRMGCLGLCRAGVERVVVHARAGIVSGQAILFLFIFDPRLGILGKCDGQVLLGLRALSWNYHQLALYYTMSQ